MTAPGRALLRRRRLVLYGPIQKRTYWFLAVLSLGLVFALWAALSYTGAVQNLFLPTPTQVWQAAVTESSTGILWPDIAASVGRIVLGFIISSVVAIPVGMLMGSYKVFEASLEPSIDFMRYTPAVAFIPLTLIWFGTSTTQKLVILFIAIFFQEVLLVMDNVKNVPMLFVDMAYTLGLSPAQILRRVIFRASLPGYCRHLAHLYGVGLDLPGRGGTGRRHQRARVPDHPGPALPRHSRDHPRDHCHRNSRSAFRLLFQDDLREGFSLHVPG